MWEDITDALSGLGMQGYFYIIHVHVVFLCIVMCTGIFSGSLKCTCVYTGEWIVFRKEAYWLYLAMGWYWIVTDGVTFCGKYTVAHWPCGQILDFKSLGNCMDSLSLG